MCNKEIVICAAIWVQDGKKRPYQPTNIPSGTVFCGLRHPSILSQLAAYGIAHKNRSVQGFLTSKNRFLTRIVYKAKLLGINVVIHEESYTSKIDHLAFEPLKKQESYLGKRKKRGLFQSSIGKLINADINGSIGIARIQLNVNPKNLSESFFDVYDRDGMKLIYSIQNSILKEMFII